MSATAASHTRSRALYRQALRYLPGGLSYPIRFFRPFPFYVSHAQGSQLYDVDGNVYTDYWCTHFALILGHAHSRVVDALREQAERGYHYGLCHDLEVRLARKVVEHVPCADRVKFANSGTEANMYAVRLARAATRRQRIGKFEGGWHGGHDALHVGVHPPFGRPAAAGLGRGLLRDTVVLPFNDLTGVERILGREELASVTVEPMMGAGGMVPADREFLRGLRHLCRETGTLLIFDEVITGFRLELAGAQGYYGVTPDLTILGKILGGGLPIGAIAGRGSVMEYTDHTRRRGEEYAFVGGTGTGNALSLAAGLATIEELEGTMPYERLGRFGARVRTEGEAWLNRHGPLVQITGLGSTFCLHFTGRRPVRTIHDVVRGDAKKSGELHRHLLRRGIFTLTPERVHGCISTAHAEQEVEAFLEAVRTWRP